MIKASLFPGQQADEDIILVLREHWFYLMMRLAGWLVFVAIIFAFDHYVPKLLPQLFQDPYLNYVNLFKNAYMLFLVLGLMMIWVLYYLNIQIITSMRVVDVTQSSLFSRTVSELTFEKIEDVTGETNGFFGTIFGYGNVLVQTAGTTERFTFWHVPKPDAVEKMLLDISAQKIKTAPVSTV